MDTEFETRLADLFHPDDWETVTTCEEFRRALEAVVDIESMDQAMKLAHEILRAQMN
jgi:hypothetical protein